MNLWISFFKLASRQGLFIIFKQQSGLFSPFDFFHGSTWSWFELSHLLLLIWLPSSTLPAILISLILTSCDIHFHLPSPSHLNYISNDYNFNFDKWLRIDKIRFADPLVAVPHALPLDHGDPTLLTMSFKTETFYQINTEWICKN